MIPKEILLKTIEQFDLAFKEVDKQCQESTKPSACHLEYFKMNEAWCKFQNAVEFDLLPFVESRP